MITIPFTGEDLCSDAITRSDAVTRTPSKILAILMGSLSGMLRL